MDITQFLAAPMQPCIYVRITPDQTIEVDQIAFDIQKQAFIDFCLDIPNIEHGISWRLLKPYTGGNGMMAKLLVALGDLAGAWTMYPRADQPALWSKSKLYPMIMAEEKPSRSRVPKPSAGDLEHETEPCECCARPMGPYGSKVHDLSEMDPGMGMCWECFLSDCVKGSPCNIEPQKVAHSTPTPRIVPPDSASRASEDLDMGSYLRNVNG